MKWQDIGEFNPKEHGTDALLLKLNLHANYETIFYGWYDPEASETHPWRFVDAHDFDEDEPDKISVNGAPPLGTVKAFVTFNQIPK